MASASRFDGADKTIAQLRKLIVTSPGQFARALRQEAEIEATECKKNTPVDTDALRSSIHVEGPIRDGRTIRAYVVAGGPSEPYALIVHEDLEAFHRVGGAKYIERPLREAAPYIPARIAARIKLSEGL